MKSHTTTISNREKEYISKNIQTAIDNCTDSNAVIFLIALLRHTGWGKKRFEDFMNDTYLRTADEYLQHWKDDVFDIMAQQELDRIGVKLDDIKPKHLSWNERACKKRLENKPNVDLTEAKKLHEEMMAFNNYLQKGAVK